MEAVHACICKMAVPVRACMCKMSPRLILLWLHCGTKQDLKYQNLLNSEDLLSTLALCVHACNLSIHACMHYFAILNKVYQDLARYSKFSQVLASSSKIKQDFASNKLFGYCFFFFSHGRVIEELLLLKN